MVVTAVTGAIGAMGSWGRSAEGAHSTILEPRGRSTSGMISSQPSCPSRPYAGWNPRSSRLRPGRQTVLQEHLESRQTQQEQPNRIAASGCAGCGCGTAPRRQIVLHQDLELRQARQKEPTRIAAIRGSAARGTRPGFARDWRH